MTRDPAFEIRPAHDNEVSRLVALWTECGLTVAYNDPEADFRFARGKPNSDVLVGVDTDAAIVASVMVGHDGHRGWLYYVAVAPSAERRGWGRAIVAGAERWLATRGVRKMQLLVRDTNADVVAFYRRLGFETAPRIVMQKWIDGIDPA